MKLPLPATTPRVSDSFRYEAVTSGVCFFLLMNDVKLDTRRLILFNRIFASSRFVGLHALL